MARTPVLKGEAKGRLDQKKWKERNEKERKMKG
jgi:hypothetical protein